MKIKFIDKQPYIEEVCINEIIEVHSTPIYLYSQKKITETYDNLKKNLSSEIFFAIKANSNQAILTLLKNLGAGADVVSMGELKRSIHAGFNPNKIIFEGVGKSKEDIELAIKNNIRLINIESFEELKLINQLGKNLNKIPNVGVRLNPDIDANTLDKISTGKKTDKFGISIDELNEFIFLSKKCSNINLIGISCHIGSQIHSLEIFEKIFNIMSSAANLCLSNSIDIQHVDLGGGFGVDYKNEKNDFDIIKLSNLVDLFFKKTPYTISFEPGRYLLAKSGIIITKILTNKINGGINFLITDAGMQTLIRPSMYGAFHKIEALNDIDRSKVNYTIAGPICESSDILSKNILLPKQKTENYLAIHDVGAYGATMASNYNSRGIPEEILIHENRFSVIHKKEIISEIIKRDSIPDWL